MIGSKIQLENSRLVFLRNPDPAILNPDMDELQVAGLAFSSNIPLRSDRDLSAFRRVFMRIAQQICDDLIGGATDQPIKMEGRPRARSPAADSSLQSAWIAS